MAEITAALVKELREMTGAGMMDCKKALAEVDGDVEAAVDWLRKKGLSKAAKKSGRTAAEGLVCVAVSDDAKTAVALEVNSETDFVARNEQFQAFVAKASQIALTVDGVEALNNADYGNGKSVADTLTDLIATIGENMSIRRMDKQTVSEGVVASYVHNSLAENMGKIAVLVAIQSSGSQDALAATGKQVAMHVAAASPLFLNVDTVDTEALDREREVLADQARASGKPEEIIEKMLEGRIRKYYEEVCLVEQVFVIDGETKISQVVANAGKEAGGDAQLVGFTRMVLGEGIEVEEAEDFAAEVAKVANA